MALETSGGFRVFDLHGQLLGEGPLPFLGQLPHLRGQSLPKLGQHLFFPELDLLPQFVVGQFLGEHAYLVVVGVDDHVHLVLPHVLTERALVLEQCGGVPPGRLLRRLHVPLAHEQIHEQLLVLLDGRRHHVDHFGVAVEQSLGVIREVFVFVVASPILLELFLLRLAEEQVHAGAALFAQHPVPDQLQVRRRQRTHLLDQLLSPLFLERRYYVPVPTERIGYVLYHIIRFVVVGLLIARVRLAGLRGLVYGAGERVVIIR